MFSHYLRPSLYIKSHCGVSIDTFLGTETRNHPMRNSTIFDDQTGAQQIEMHGV